MNVTSTNGPIVEMHMKRVSSCSSSCMHVTFLI